RSPRLHFSPEYEGGHEALEEAMGQRSEVDLRHQVSPRLSTGAAFSGSGGSAPRKGKAPRGASFNSTGAVASARSMESAMTGSKGRASRSALSSGTKAA